MNVPACENCRFYIPGRYVRTSTCSRYIAYRGRGKIVHEWTESVRLSESKCGSKGRFFVPKEKSESCERQETFVYLLNDDE